MQLPRKGILIRLLIYVPLLLFFGFRAYSHWQGEKAAEQDPAVQEVDLESHKRTIMTPDGKTLEIYEITQEDAERLGLGSPAQVGPAPDPAPKPKAENKAENKAGGGAPAPAEPPAADATASK